MTGTLKKLTIEHLRGSVRPFFIEFEKTRRFTIVYGENGTGKSTICDAFDFLGEGTVGSLAGRGLGKTTPYWHSIGAAPGSVKVVLESAGGSSSAQLIKGEAVVDPPSSRPLINVLRRSQILDLVAAKPADRYTALGRFIDMSAVEAGENSLRSLIRTLHEDSERASTRVLENQSAIANFWEEAERPGTDVLAWAQAELVRDVASSDAEANQLRDLQSAYMALTSLAAQLPAVESNIATATQANATAQAQRDLAVSAVSATAPAAIGILQAAQQHFRGHPDPRACPLCESAERAQGLPARVEEQLAAVSALGQLRDAEIRFKNAEAVVISAQQRRRTLEESAQRLADAFNELVNREWPVDIVLPRVAIPAEVRNLAAWLAASNALPDQWRQAELMRLDKKRFNATLKRAMADLDDNVTRHSEIARLLPSLESALEVIEQERKQYTDRLLAAIADDVGVLYELVHEGEGLNKISLFLDPKKKGSLEIGVTFAGMPRAAPQAYFSDSHLDTLGLCVFIALARRESAGEKILVLDDVLASVDEPHVDRVIKMLYEQADCFRHVVVTTHYRAWRERYRWGLLSNGQCHWVELGQWTAATGMSKTQPSTEPLLELRQHLQQCPPSLQVICGSAGVLLEAICNFLTLRYECDVPRRKGELTLGDLLPRIKGKLKDALRVEVKRADGGYDTYLFADKLERLQQLQPLRNVIGCHYNSLAQDLSPTEAIEFGTLVYDMGAALICEDEGWPGSDKSGSYWATRGETRRLHPLKKSA